MKVSKLIEKLKTIDPDMVVFTNIESFLESGENKIGILHIDREDSIRITIFNRKV